MNETASRTARISGCHGDEGRGTISGSQLMAEIGDVTRFTHRYAVGAFAGVDLGANDSEYYSQKSVHTSKHGSPVLRKTLFQIIDVLIKAKPNNAVYRFMDK